MSILKNKTEGAIEVSRDSGEKGKGKSGSKPAIVVVFICEILVGSLSPHRGLSLPSWAHSPRHVLNLPLVGSLSLCVLTLPLVGSLYSLMDSLVPL